MSNVIAQIPSKGLHGKLLSCFKQLSIFSMLVLRHVMSRTQPSQWGWSFSRLLNCSNIREGQKSMWKDSKQQIKQVEEMSDPELHTCKPKELHNHWEQACSSDAGSLHYFSPDADPLSQKPPAILKYY